MSTPEVDLIITFRATPKSTSLSKQQLRHEASKAERQYARLIDTLTYAGLKAVGRRGEALGHLLVFVTCPRAHVVNLVKRERESDFLSGLSVTPVHSGVEANRVHLSPSDRLRLVYSHVTSMPSDGGLGITPGVADWDMVESVMALHDKDFNDAWLKLWNIREITSVQLDKIREQFGEPIALYFAFLSTYTTFLIFPAVLGVVAHFLYTPYSPTYSFLLLIWSTVFTEWWRVHERVLSLRWGTRGSFRVEKRRAQYKKETISGAQNGGVGTTMAINGLGSLEGGTGWWRRELKVLASVPVILAFAGVLFMLLTSIFVFEAFVTQLYTGPGQRVITLLPTLAFVALVPRFLALYQSLARTWTDWENHAHESSYAASLTIKTFIMSAIVAYGGLALSAFVYVPFGEGLMAWAQNVLWIRSNNSRTTAALTGDGESLTSTVLEKADVSSAQSEAHHHHHHHHEGFWEMDRSNARRKLNPGRLRDQMFAYTVTNQIVNTFMEIGLPYVMRDVLPLVMAKLKGEKAKPKGKGKIENGKRPRTVSLSTPALPASNSTADAAAAATGATSTANANADGSSGSAPNSNAAVLKKRVIFEDEQEKGGLEEREYLDRVRAEVALPEYTLFDDYSEMVVQFGYVVLWSGIWCLAPAMALLNNILELRSDAFKMTVHHRRPLSAIRTDTIGPWLDAMAFLTWLGALCNSALVYLFHPSSASASAVHLHPHVPGTVPFSAAFSEETVVEKVHRQLFSAAGAVVENAGPEFPRVANGHGHGHGDGHDSRVATRDLLITALVIALAASHGYMVLRRIVRHVVEKLVWAGSVERVEREMEERVVRERFLGVVSGGGGPGPGPVSVQVQVVGKNVNVKAGEEKEFVVEGGEMDGFSHIVRKESRDFLEGSSMEHDSGEVMMREEDMRDIEDEINEIETVDGVDDGTTVVGEGTVVDAVSPRPGVERELEEEKGKGKAEAAATVAAPPSPVVATVEGWGARFWDHDEGVEEIHRIVKEA